jgi:putative transcriptional regulator
MNLKMQKSSFESSPSEGLPNMKQTGIISAAHEPGQPQIETDTDRAAVEALSEDQLRAGALADPDAQPLPQGNEAELSKQGLRRLVNVKKLREELGLTQEAFAATYKIPVGTLRDWEQCRKHPDAPARAYLTIIARDPKAIASLLSEAA